MCVFDLEYFQCDSESVRSEVESWQLLIDSCPGMCISVNAQERHFTVWNIARYGEL